MTNWIDGHGIGRGIYDVFISYHRSNRDLVSLIDSHLRKEGLTTFTDNLILPGEDVTLFLTKVMEHSRIVLVIWSNKSVESQWVCAEAEYARQRKRLVSCKINDCNQPLPFNTFQTSDLSGWSGNEGNANWRQIVDLISFRVNNGDAKEEMGGIKPN